MEFKENVANIALAFYNKARNAHSAVDLKLDQKRCENPTSRTILATPWTSLTIDIDQRPYADIKLEKNGWYCVDVKNQYQFEMFPTPKIKPFTTRPTIKSVFDLYKKALKLARIHAKDCRILVHYHNNKTTTCNGDRFDKLTVLLQMDNLINFQITYHPDTAGSLPTQNIITFTANHQHINKLIMFDDIAWTD